MNSPDPRDADYESRLLRLYQNDPAKVAAHQCLIAAGLDTDNLWVAVNTFFSQLARHGYAVRRE